jgi:N-acyl-D-amino-acid deacylase
MQYDLKIEGGLIIDGSGQPGAQGSVAVKDGRIAAVGTATGSAAKTIEADGLVVAPGFVDIHTHYDAQVMWDRMLTISPWHGVTTVVMGNCGFSVAPTRPEHRIQIMRTLEKVEGMNLAALEGGMGYDWPFVTFAEYLDAIVNRGVGINVACLVGHTAVRMYVMGDDGYERTASEAEIQRMQEVVRASMYAGAVGFSTSRGPAHIGYLGKPVPSRKATLEELMALTSVLGEVGTGVVEAALGDRFNIRDCEAIARGNGRPVTFSFLAGREPWDKLFGALEWMHRLAREGVNLVPQISARPLTMEFNLREPFPLENLPVFRPVSQAIDIAGKIRVYSDPAFRQQLKDVIARKESAAASRILSPDAYCISFCPTEPSLEQCTVGEVSRERGVDPIDLILDLSIAAKLTARFQVVLLNDNENEVGTLLRETIGMLGLSDAGAHASQLCDACAPTYLLGHWVREKRALSLEAAVRLMSARTAEVYSLRDRGRLAVGAPADLVVFDPKTVAAGPLRRVHDLPGGADRLVSDAQGVELVMVNGVIIRREGRDAIASDGPMPGKVLLGDAVATA